MDPLNPPAIHGEAVAGRQATVRNTLLKLTEDLNRHTFDAAELLYEAQENRYFAQWGFDSFGDYAEQELGLKMRKSQYLSRIVKVMNICGIKRSDYEPAGVTKLRLITTLNPEEKYFNQETKQHEDMAEHITSLVAEAPELSTKEVEDRVAHLKGMDGDNAMVTKSYSVTRSCYENTVKRCFESIRKILGSKGRDETGIAIDYPDGAVLEALCSEWNADPRNFLEESDCNQDQIEIPTEKSNDRAPNQQGISSTEEVSLGGGNVCSGGPGEDLTEIRERPTVDSTEIPQEQFQGPAQSVIIRTED